MSGSPSDPAFDAFEHHDQGKVLLLRGPEDEKGTALRTALEILVTLIEPLSVEATFSRRRDGVPDGSRPSPSVLLVARSLEGDDPEARRAYHGSKAELLDALTPDAILSWLAARTPACADAEHTVGWSELLLDRSRARLFDPLLAARPLFRVRASERPGHVHELAIDQDGDKSYLARPTRAMELASMAPPIVVRFVDDFVLSLYIELHWSLWTRRASAERAATDAVVARLSAAGWVLQIDDQERESDY